MDKFYAAYSNSALPTPLHRTHSPNYQNCSRWTISSSSIIFCSQNKSLKLNHLRRCNSTSTTTFSSPCSDLSSRGNFLSFSLINNYGFKVRAVSEEGDDNAVVAAAAAITSKWGSSLQLVTMFGVWYLLNIYFNIYNKQVLLLLHCSFKLL